MENCIFCKLGNKDDITFLEETKYWIVRLSLEQHTLGCLIIVLKKHKEGLKSVLPEEFLEFSDIIKKYEKKLEKLFNPDIFNYLQTNNKVRHLHFHMIPRYKKAIRFKDKEFLDKTYGDMVIQKFDNESKELFLSLKTLLTKDIIPRQ